MQGCHTAEKPTLQNLLPTNDILHNVVDQSLVCMNLKLEKTKPKTLCY